MEKRLTKGNPQTNNGIIKVDHMKEDTVKAVSNTETVAELEFPF